MATPTRILIRWDLSAGKPKGTAIPHEGTICSSKIVFPERSYDIRKLGAGVWECAVVHDTQPHNPCRGALIVRPLRVLQYAWVADGPQLWGVRKIKYMCIEYPALDVALAPGSAYDRIVESDRRNEAWRAALARQDLWIGSLWGRVEEFFAIFGEPTAVLSSCSGEGQTVLVYEHGEKIVETRSLTSVWTSSATGEIRRVDAVIEAEFHLDRAPSCCFWDGVARLGGADAYSPPYTMTRFEELDAQTRGPVLELLRASTISPEEMALTYWQQYVVDGRGLATAWAELAALHAPGAEIQVQRYLGQTHYAESDDGYRSAGSYDAWYICESLHVGGQTFIVSDTHELGNCYPRCEIESERRRLIVERWRQIDEALVCPAPELTAHSAEISGATDAEWTARYRATWAGLVNEHRHFHAVQAAQIVRQAQRKVAARVEFQVSAQPVITKDVGYQGVWRLAAAQSESQIHETELPDTPSIEVPEPPEPPRSTTIADLRAKFGRR